ncbi:g7426 [Coccomyxa elongata]
MAVSGVPGAGLRVQEGKVHFCILCDYPVAVYGRVWPCLHTYCLSCASSLPSCSLCQTEILRVERVTREQGLHISPATLQSFKTEEDLQNHAEEVQKRFHAILEADRT